MLMTIAVRHATALQHLEQQPHTFERDSGHVVELTVESDEGTTDTTTETVGVEDGDTGEDDGTTVEAPGFEIGSAVTSLGKSVKQRENHTIPLNASVCEQPLVGEPFSRRHQSTWEVD
jgi:hypothetical protein